MCEMQKCSKKLKKKMEKYPVRRLPVGKSERKDKNWDQQLNQMEKKWQKIKK